MSPEETLASLLWQQQVPSERQAMLPIPVEIIDASLNRASGKVGCVQHSAKVNRWVDGWKSRLSTKPGFVCLQLSDGALTDEDLRTVYAVISNSLGQLNERYGAFFDVKDHGLDHTKSAIPVSKTRACSGFHTDSSSVDYCPEVVGLLCLHPGFRGGESLLVNAADLYCWLWRNHRGSLRPLSKPIKRDVITPGAAQNNAEIERNAFPIFSVKDNALKFRYMRYWIGRAYEKLEMELPCGLQNAMDLVDQFFDDSRNVFSTKLSRGEMLFVNNQHLCHSRTAFTDATDGLRKRTLVRTWVDGLRTHRCDQGHASGSVPFATDECLATKSAPVESVG